ncbi:gfo/Idh/MocA family oxidoreductase, partial [Lacticaseibacillus rhamnosus]
QFTNHHPIDGATLAYMKYSSKYDAFLAGQWPNFFNPESAGGALIDQGIYLVYDSLAWFGVPDNSVYLPHFLKSGVDGEGGARLVSDQLAVTLSKGKTTNSFLPDEIYSGKQTLTMDNAAELDTI